MSPPNVSVMVDTQGAAVRGGKAANRVIKISVVEGEIAKQKVSQNFSFSCKFVSE